MHMYCALFTHNTASMIFDMPAEQADKSAEHGIVKKAGKVPWDALYNRRALIHFPYEVPIVFLAPKGERALLPLGLLPSS